MIKKIFFFLLFCSYNLMAQDTPIRITQQQLDTTLTDYSNPIFKKFGFTFPLRQGLFFYADSDSMPRYLFYIPTEQPFTSTTTLKEYIKHTLTTSTDCHLVAFQSGVFIRRNQIVHDKLKQIAFSKAQVFSLKLQPWDNLDTKSIRVAYGTLTFKHDKQAQQSATKITSLRIDGNFQIKIDDTVYNLNLINYNHSELEIGYFVGFDKTE